MSRPWPARALFFLGGLVAFVVAGAATTIIVAWIAMLPPLPSRPAAQFRMQKDLGWIFPGPAPAGVLSDFSGRPETWSGQVWSRTGRCDLLTDSEIYYMRHYTWPPWTNAGQNTPDRPPKWWPGPVRCPLYSPANCFGLRERYVGWPMLALHSREWVAQRPGMAGGLSHPYTSGYAGTITTEGMADLSSWRVLPSRLTREPLPTLPLWPGFALNTLFYAALAWGLWQVPLYIRRRHRLKRHRCTRCGYSLAGLAAAGTGATCPECGLAAARP